MRPIWTGALTFGLVNIPVRLHSAVQAKETRELPPPAQRPTSRRSSTSASAQKDGEAVDWKDIVKGYEYTKGKFVVLDDDDFKAAAIESSKTIEILDFVGSDEIDPRYFETPYYLSRQKGGEKAYALLREAIKQTGKVGIGKITMRTNSLHLAGVKAVGDAIVLEIMRFGDELVDAERVRFPERRRACARRSCRWPSSSSRICRRQFDPSKYADDYHANLMKIIKAKMKGKKIDIAEPDERESTQVVDLIARLQESLEMGKRPRGATHHAKPAKRAQDGQARDAA